MEWFTWHLKGLQVKNSIKSLLMSPESILILAHEMHLSRFTLLAKIDNTQIWNSQNLP